MKYFLLIVSCIIFLNFSANCVAANPGDVTLINDNWLAPGSQDFVQFQLITNGDGLVNTSVLTASPPDNRQILSYWDFSDQTTSFTVYIRDVSKNQPDYTPCSEKITYSRSQPSITIFGSSNGAISKCEIKY